MDLNLLEFAKRYIIDKKNKKLLPRKNRVIFYVFPENHSSNPENADYHKYCKNMLIKYKPWRNNVKLAWNSNTNENVPNETIVASWKKFLDSELGKEKAPEQIKKIVLQMTY